ncbi:MAG: hypothetical protein U0T82_06320 [Bacteroidales bacterium]
MRTRSMIFLMAVLTLAGSVLSSCNKEDSQILNNDLQTIEDDALMEAADEDINTYADQFDALGDDMLKSGVEVVTDTCPLVTHVRNGDTVVVTIDFGENCIDRNLNSRSGKIIITKVGRRIDEGSYRRVTLENFIVNGNKIEGTRTITNLGLNENSNPHFSVVLTGGKLTTADGDVLERSYERDREWITGFDTPNAWDNEYMITGTASGVNYLGKAYTRTILEALHVKMACRFIVSGVIESQVEGEEAVTLDYGDGECDNYATVSKGGENRQIELRMNRHRWVKRAGN